LGYKKYIIKAWLIGNAGFRTIVLNMSEHSRNPTLPLLSSVFDWHRQFTFVLYFHSLLYCTPIYSWTIEQIDRDIVLLKITQIWVITICMVLDLNTVIFQKEKRGGGLHIEITGMQDSNSQCKQKWKCDIE
jgi:hypothetical protein